MQVQMKCACYKTAFSTEIVCFTSETLQRQCQILSSLSFIISSVHVRQSLLTDKQSKRSSLKHINPSWVKHTINLKRIYSIVVQRTFMSQTQVDSYNNVVLTFLANVSQAVSSSSHKGLSVNWVNSKDMALYFLARQGPCRTGHKVWHWWR